MRACRRKWSNERRHVSELEVVRRGERRVEGRVARKMRSRVIGLLFEHADLGLRADEADVERARWTMTQVPMMAMSGAAIQAHSTRPSVRNTSQLSGTSATRYAARQRTTKPASGTSTPAASRSDCAGGVGGGAEIVPSADAARVVWRAVFARRWQECLAVHSRAGCRRKLLNCWERSVWRRFVMVGGVDAQVAGEVIRRWC